MNETKFTPGPWSYRSREYDDWGLVRAADGYPVASANVLARIPDEGPHKVFCSDGGFPEPPEMTANAQLIAAAPDLLAACEAAVAADEAAIAELKERFGYIPPEFNSEITEQLRAALALAKGGAP